jgi:hypothetical protein
MSAGPVMLHLLAPPHATVTRYRPRPYGDSVFFSNCSWEEGAEVPSATWTDELNSHPREKERCFDLFERGTQIVSCSNLKQPFPPITGQSPCLRATRRRVLCCPRGGGGASRKRADWRGTRAGQHTQNDTVKVILLGRYGRGAPACYIPRYVLFYFSAIDHCGIYTPVGKAAFLKSRANIPSHIDDLLARLSRVVCSTSMRRQSVICRSIRLDLVRSVNKILDGRAKRFRNNITLIGPRRDDRLNELFHEKHSPR